MDSHVWVFLGAGCVCGGWLYAVPLWLAPLAVAPTHADSEFRLTRPPGRVRSGPCGSDHRLVELRPFSLS